MKLALTDDVWSRFYGPYGNRAVHEAVAALRADWDLERARDLFWEELHHQDDIYPVTYAALPWLLELSPATGAGLAETQLFVSHVIACACFDGQRAQAYRGLSLEIADHQHAWIPQMQWLSARDQPVLAALERWFSETHLTLAERWLAQVCGDAMVSAYALEGFATAQGSPRVARAVQLWADGETLDLIQSELGAFQAQDTRVIALLYPHLRGKVPEMLSFLPAYPGCSFVPGARPDG